MSDEFDGAGNLVYGRRGKRHKNHTHQKPHDPHAEKRRIAGLLLLGVHDKRCNKNYGESVCNCGLDEARASVSPPPQP